MPARRRDQRDPTVDKGRVRTELREQQREIQRLRRENEILREAAEPLIHHAPACERFAFTHRLRGRFGIRRLCRILLTDHSDYHAWVGASTRRHERNLNDHELLAWIVEIHTARSVRPTPASDHMNDICARVFAVTSRICGGTTAVTWTWSPGSEPVFFTWMR